VAERTLNIEVPASDVLHMHIVRSQAARDVLAERDRQIEREGWTPEHDDEHGDGSMATAAACYALGQSWVSGRNEAVSFWPWDDKWNKIGRDRRRNLVKAGALILAEIERLDRAATPGVKATRTLPHPGSPEASAMLDSLLAEYNYPANTKNAARAGWEAAERWLRTAGVDSVDGGQPK
jgi:hypothetical protein